MNGLLKQPNNQKKSSRRKYIIAAVFLLLLIIPVYVFKYIESKPDPASEALIREAAAKQVNKDPNNITADDFIKVTQFKLTLNNQRLPDIKLLEEFKNMEVFEISCMFSYPESTPPKWMINLEKLGLIDLDERNFLDLGPLKNEAKLRRIEVDCIPIKNIQTLKKLPNLNTLYLNNTQTTNLNQVSGLKKLKYLGISMIDDASNLDSLKNLTNLQTLDLSNTSVSDFDSLKYLTFVKNLYLSNSPIPNLEPLRGLSNLESLRLNGAKIDKVEPLKELKNLKHLDIGFTEVIDIEPLGELSNLQSLNLHSTKVLDIEPVVGLQKLRYLDIGETNISSLEPIKNLKYLEKVDLLNCTNITDKQIEDLQKALPNLKIERGN